jgi:HPt (histidine-containing phosphotransfer) domain-containing protein
MLADPWWGQLHSALLNSGIYDMKHANAPLLQRLTASLVSTAQQLLHQVMHMPEQPDSPALNAGNMPDFAADGTTRERCRQPFSNEMFAELLIELPGRQGELSQAYRTGNPRILRDQVHQLLGAVAYCDLPELEAALRTLHRALITKDPDNIDNCYAQACSAINSTLTHSGYSDGT